ncbi:MAG: hypothetical protein GF320_21900 [Armatimonadia bacterium]|nr:hypothetical protein [Armatimonadia bacterium]
MDEVKQQRKRRIRQQAGLGEAIALATALHIRGGKPRSAVRHPQPQPEERPDRCDVCHQLRRELGWSELRGQWLCGRCVSRMGSRVGPMVSKEAVHDR